MVNKKPLRTRILERLTGMHLVSRDDWQKAIDDWTSQRRSPIQLGSREPLNDILELPYNYALLVKYATNNEVVRTVHEAIIKEVTRNRWAAKPRWMSKCNLCGHEYETKKAHCDVCHGNEMLEPDPEQKKVLEAFIDDPNPDDEMVDIVKSALRYMLTVDDWYLSLQYPTADVPMTIYVEDSVTMRIVADKYGRIGNGDYFCTTCTRDDPEHVYKEGEPCEHDPSHTMKETAYVCQVGGFVKARFAKDEVLHGKTDAWLPVLYGTSKLVSCLRVVMSILAMDTFNLDNYSEGKLAQILVFHGMTQQEANDLMAGIKVQRDKAEADSLTGTVRKKLRTLGLGSKEGVTAVDTMPPSKEMQSLDWWKLWREAVCAVYGVTPVFTGVVESGKTGNNPRMQIDVQNNTTEMYQRGFEEPFNNFVVPKLGVTDWLFKFNPVEEKDEMQDITILAQKVETVIKASNAGMDAELTDEGEVKISGKPKPFINPFAQQDGGKQPFGQQGTKPFKEEELFPAEKATRKAWLVRQVDVDREGGDRDE